MTKEELLKKIEKLADEVDLVDRAVGFMADTLSDIQYDLEEELSSDSHIAPSETQ